MVDPAPSTDRILFCPHIAIPFDTVPAEVGFIAVVGHTHVLQEGPVTGKAIDVIAAANTATVVALRFVRPGKRHEERLGVNKIGKISEKVHRTNRISVIRPVNLRTRRI
ncbi:hypothetical protein L2E82_38858 [Cichorium intybus]|uniref:Uncharacterized protein n=1 Tax=Cichorium intybus TaxID=13427 RepID=A0ACB9AGL2_CICIN|nr:hypothetical protein L2E82_38858 [Cichorium intybus]